MSIAREHDKEKNTIIIKVSGRFDFSCHSGFRQAYQEGHGDRTRFIVDLSAADYMDSAALGMLLLLREHAGNERTRVVLRKPGSVVARVLKVANFDQLFVVEG